MDPGRRHSGAGAGNANVTPTGSSSTNTFFNPTKLLKKGWSGVTSPVAAMKDAVLASATPRGTVFGMAGMASGASTPSSRNAMPAPSEYPSLFDVRAPAPLESLTLPHRQSSDSSSSATGPGGGLLRSGSASSDVAHSSRTNSRTASASQSRESSLRRQHLSSSSASSVSAVEDIASMDEEERAYLSVFHHNLHSVLTNPKSNNWGGAMLDLLYQNPLEADIPLPSLSIPGLDLVGARDFDPYLKKYGKLAKLYEDNHALPISEQLSSSQVPSISIADEDVAKCLNVVPSFFFRPDFDLTDPATFEQVMSMKTSLSLQEELSGYLDRVEFTLLRQVSSRSDRFFEASANQEVMKQSITVACDQVATLRKTMDRLRNGLADKSLDIVSLHRRQKRIAELHEVVTMIEGVKNAESAVEALVQCEEYTSALDLIENAQTTLREHLKGIHGLSALSDKLQGYRGLIASQISQRFISIVTSPDWMFEDDEEAPPTTTKRPHQRKYSTGSDVSVSDKEVSTAEMKRLVEVLFRLDALTDVVGKYRDQLTEEIKVVVKTVVTETIAMSDSSKSNGADGSSADSKVSIQLRALSSDEFLQCVKMIFEHLLMILERAVVVQNVLTRAMQKKIDDATAEEHQAAKEQQASTEVTSPTGETWTPTESITAENEMLGDWKKKSRCNKVIQEIDDVLRKTCEFSQRSVSNLFAVRKEVQAVYTMPQLRLLYDTTMEFVVNIEKLTTKTDYTLRGSLFSQLKLFLEKYHQTQMAKLVSTLDHELWKNTEISVARHKALEDLSSGRGVSMMLSDDREVSGETASPLKAVSVCGKTFRIVWSVLLMLEIVMNYMSCAANFPVLATDVLQRSIEIFRLFNSRTTQLVLGAGAMQIARLKSISARHLALASQSLELTMTVIPHIKAALAAHFTDRQKLLLDEFDRVLRDYAEHNEKIFSKFTNIVEDQIMKRFLENVHANVDYDAANLSVPTNPMKGIKDSTLKLHAVLSPVLSPPQMKDVMTRVFDMFTQKLPECFKQVKPKSAAGKKRVVEDIALFTQSFVEVTAVEFDGDALLRHFKSVYDVQ
ncbi:hypothetical protein Poli38472_002296 [Pythium oligandrum]|uniref:Vacuolar protein sorting-associated protein 54 n=1 Tax=Pythium oligandrum TaxID=41045 RepID=A0A8K1CHK0_PYTOL|nr:hypothetical protein Poli38472_002296 [Pythium oligandrum]|eukprot:TMW63355.1 hypothetical protein Poli38472_002296 [Pythium oligandrum]